MPALQPLTGKELMYIVDSISNEDLLMKQNAATAAMTQNPTIQQACLRYIRSHEQHMQSLIQCLQQHQQMAPTMPQ
ncbi:hypothetical protein PASE110613_11210 [Paenibacillus sediminis]|uniref:Spore coat protein n=1 Tax=Paenibacillus sediminis TaxID=664909 RepID=A0ABS4H4R4_9BACL|nr:hypothetical protein [Paenibacillus sediminis]MBP1937523.1 hypothetical protein [Paenibacillus sediminis]